MMMVVVVVFVVVVVDEYVSQLFNSVSFFVGYVKKMLLLLFSLSFYQL